MVATELKRAWGPRSMRRVNHASFGKETWLSFPEGVMYESLISWRGGAKKSGDEILFDPKCSGSEKPALGMSLRALHGESPLWVDLEKPDWVKTRRSPIWVSGI